MPDPSEPAPDEGTPPASEPAGSSPVEALRRAILRLVPGPDASVRHRAAFRGAVAALAVLLVGLPFAITLPGSDTDPAGKSPPPAPEKAPCRPLGVDDPVMAPRLGASGEAFTIFGPTLRNGQGSLVHARRIEVWLNTATPERDGEALADGPIELLGEAKAGRACAFTVWSQIPELQRGSYVVGAFAITPQGKDGFEELGTTQLDVASAGRPVDASDVESFVAGFLDARVGGFGKAARGLVSDEGAAAFDEKRGSLAPLLDNGYRRGTVTDVAGPIDDEDTYEVSVAITRKDAKPLEEAYLVGAGENPRGDALALLVLGAATRGA